MGILVLQSPARQKIALHPEETVGGRQRANVFDPFGNRVELIAA